MDKYEFNIKVEQIKKLVNKGDYETAMKIADTIDWRRVRSTSLLTMVSQVYERNEEYQDAKDILLLAFERAPIGKGLLFKLTDLALREGNIKEAEAYYREFCDLAGDDPRENLLRFLILEAKEAPVEQQINSLERYCEEELDEKWLYHLAELYQQAGREEDCVRICDKIMLMFGLGKYVDKAMELKLQYAPLTKYQMDLVENREKYEEKLRAVEEKYENGVYRGRREEPEEEYYDAEEGEADAPLQDEDGGAPYGGAREEDYEDSPEEFPGEMSHPALEEDVEASLHEARAEEDLAKEVSRMEPYQEEENSPAEETRIFRNVRDVRSDIMQAEEGQMEAAAAKEEPVHEFEEEEETIVEDWDLEPDEDSNSNHLMIEAENPEKGLALALESLKKIHRELGTKNPVAKISGENLSRRGVFSVADRLVGKDLVVERAADLDAAAVEELVQLMEQNGTGMVVVLIDTPARLEKMHGTYPALAGKFQYIGCEREVSSAADEREKELMRLQAEREAEDARRRLAEREEEIRRQAARDAEDARRRQAEEAARRQAEWEEQEARRREEERQQELYRQEEERRQAEAYRRQEAEMAAPYGREAQPEETYQPEDAYHFSAEEPAGGYDPSYAQTDGYSVDSREESYDSQGENYGSQETYGRGEERYEGTYGAEDAGYRQEDLRRQAEEEAEDAVRRQAEREADEARRQEEYDSELRRRQEREDSRSQMQYETDGGEEEYPDGEEESDGSEMDVEEFVQYACKYASEIDCSISGKSMLALYERAEMMEEDGIALTKTAAEDLIEEAADKAEKKSFGGLFSSKYDKDGLLILKEKHFFD